MQNPLVSVIIPVYNGEKFISQAVESVLSQEYGNFELLIIDDGSTDKTRLVASDFCRDSRVKYVCQDNSGVSSARNKGIGLSRGEYIAFLDADDVWLPDKLKLQTDELNNDLLPGFVYCGYYIIDEKGEIRGERKIEPVRDFLEDLLLVGNIVGPPSGVIAARKIIEDTGGFNQRLSTAADWDMWLKCASSYKYSLGISQPLFKYRVHGNNMHYNVRAQEKDTRIILNDFFNSSACGRMRGIRSKVFANAFLMFTKSYLKNKDFLRAAMNACLFFYYYIVSLVHPAGKREAGCVKEKNN